MTLKEDMAVVNSQVASLSTRADNAHDRLNEIARDISSLHETVGIGNEHVILLKLDDRKRVADQGHTRCDIAQHLRDQKSVARVILDEHQHTPVQSTVHPTPPAGCENATQR